MPFTTPIHTNEQSLDRVLGAGLPVLLVFWRRECVPCQQLDAALSDLAAAYAGKALVAKVDIQDNPALVRRYGVSQLPELIFLREKSEVARAQGAAGAAALRAWLGGLLAGQARPAPSGPGVPLEGRAASAGAATPGAGHGSTGNSHVPRQPTGETSSAPVTVTDATFDRLVGQSDKPVLVDFWAPWCGPCRAVAPAVERLAQEYAGRAIIAKLNVDENPRTAQRFGITGIPALYIFERGRVAERLVGAQPISALRQALARHVGR